MTIITKFIVGDHIIFLILEKPNASNLSYILRRCSWEYEVKIAILTSPAFSSICPKLPVMHSDPSMGVIFSDVTTTAQ